jgi:hypothetical protein
MEVPTPRATLKRTPLDTVVTILVVGLIAIVGFLAWPALVEQFQIRMGGAVPPALLQPTAIVRPAPAQNVVRPVVVPGVAQNEATAQAMYDAAVQEVAPVPNVNPAPAPAQLVTKPADRQAAPDVVPTAEPRPANDGIFGSKPAVVNPQEEHACLHGQVWTARGCKNPTPTR